MQGREQGKPGILSSLSVPLRPVSPLRRTTPEACCSPCPTSSAIHMSIGASVHKLVYLAESHARGERISCFPFHSPWYTQSTIQDEPNPEATR